MSKIENIFNKNDFNSKYINFFEIKTENIIPTLRVIQTIEFLIKCQKHRSNIKIFQENNNLKVSHNCANTSQDEN